jgi:hypothetical protein
MFYKSMILFAMVSILAGCGSAPSYHKAGVSAYDAASEVSQCKYEIGINGISQAERKELIKDCMQAKGFRYY